MTPHNNAAKNDIAPSVLLPGDPLRAKYIAETFLENVREVTAVRNMLGFTGVFHGKPVTVMGSGMGAASAGLYSYELFALYGVERIIRIGTCGGLDPRIQVKDLVIAMTASTDTNYADQYNLRGTYAPCADFALLEKAVASAQKRSIPFYAGSVFSSNFFSVYNALGADSWKPWAAMGALAQDMETHALYCNAAYLKKRALSILFMSDSCVHGVGLTGRRDHSDLDPMFTVALDCLE